MKMRLDGFGCFSLSLTSFPNDTLLGFFLSVSVPDFCFIAEVKGFPALPLPSFPLVLLLPGILICLGVL